MDMSDGSLTVVVPIFNEVGSIKPLYDRLVSVLSTLRRRYEIIFVDDGSTDGSAAALDDIAARDSQIRILHFRRNYGKSVALDAAFRNASGSIVITLDGDMQNDPAEIPHFIEKIEQGADVLCGWRRRRSASINKVISSAVFNAVMRRISDAPIHDFNCGFKAFRSECLAGLRLHGGLHRFVPALLSWQGFSVDEVEITDHKRWSGRSKYSAWRIPTSAWDLLTIILIGKCRKRALLLFASIALPAGLIGIVALTCALMLSALQVEPLWSRLVLYTAVILIVSSAVLLGVGLLGDLVKSVLPSAAPDYLIRYTKQGDQAEIVDSADVKRRQSR